MILQVGLKISILNVIFMSILKELCKKPFGGSCFTTQMGIFGVGPSNTDIWPISIKGSMKKLHPVKQVGNKNQYWSIHLNMEHWDPKTAGL